MNKARTMWRYAIAMLFAVVLATTLRAQESPAEVRARIKKDLPHLLANNNAGTEFWMSIPPGYFAAGAPPGGGIPSFKLYISSGVKTQVLITGQGFTRSVSTIANDIIEVTVPQSTAQPYERDINPATPKHREDNVLTGKGLNIRAKDPIIVYGVTRIPYTSDGFLAVPVSGLGKEYVVGAYYDGIAVRGSGFWTGPSETVITAPYDQTVVTVRIGGNSETRTGAGRRTGQTFTRTLNKGDVIAIEASGANYVLTGTYIRASKPVSVVSGNLCTDVPVGTVACDYTVEMELPMQTWGNTYHVTPIFCRQKPSVLHIMAKKPGTTLLFNGAPNGLISQAPGGEEEKGWYERRAYNGVGGEAVSIGGDNPIYIHQFNPGNNDDGGCTTDPFQMVLTPVEQYQTEIVFATPGINGGMSYPHNHINLVYTPTVDGFVPDDLEFGTVEAGQIKWQRLSTIFGSFPGKPIPGEVNGKKYNSKHCKLPGDGVYRIRAKEPFAAYAYGNSDYDSYGFPTSVALGNLELPDTVAPVPEYTVNCDGSVSGPNNGRPLVRDMPNESDIRSNLARIIMVQEASFNYDFSFDEFEVGTSRETRWDLSVIDRTQDARATLQFMDQAGNDTIIVIDYKAFAVAIDPVSRDFGLMKAGAAPVQTVTLINRNQTNPITVERLELKSNNQGFQLLNVTLPFEMQPGERKDIEVQFTATQDGIFKDSIGIAGCNLIYVSEVKAEVASPIIEVTDKNFLAVPVNTTRNDQIVIRNRGRVPLVVTAIADPTDAVFTRSLAAITLPLTIAPGADATLPVSFTPLAVQDYTARVVVTSDAGENTKNYGELLGKGIAPGLAVKGVSFGRRRYNYRTDINVANPAPPYTTDATGAPAEIEVQNTGTSDVIITEAVVAGNTGDGQAQLVVTGGLGQFGSLRLTPGESRRYAVQFIANANGEGDHSLDVGFRFNEPDGNQAERVAVLDGTGIVPRIEMTPTVNFGTFVVGTSNPITRTVTLTNTQHANADRVTITDLTFTGPTAGFAFTDKNAIGLPRTLNPGESLTFDVTFQATGAPSGNRTVSIVTTSDAEQERTTVLEAEVEIILTGNPVFVGNATTVTDICPDANGTLTATITNEATATANLLISSLVLAGAPEFTVANVRHSDGTVYTLPLANTVSLAPSEALTVSLAFAPTVKSSATYTGSIEVTSNNGRVDEVTEVQNRIDFEATSFYQVANAAVRVTDASGANSVQTLPGQDFNVVVSAAGAIDARASVSKVKVQLEYIGRLIGPLKNGGNIAITPSAGWALSTVAGEAPATTYNAATGIETLTFYLTQAAGGVGAGDLATVRMLMFLLPDQETKKTEIKAVTSIVDNVLCSELVGSTAENNIGAICVLDFRAIRVSTTGYALNVVKPNPIQSTGTIEYGVGLAAPTSLVLVNSNGDKVATLVNQTLQPGKYTVQVDARDLPSGTYFCRMESGPYTETVAVVIAK